MLKERIVDREKYGGGGGGEGGGKIAVLSNPTSTQIPNHKTSKKNDISNSTVNKLLDNGS